MPDDFVSWESLQQVRNGLVADQNALAKELAEIDRRTSIHEAVCAERYKGLDKKLTSLMYICVILLISELFGTTPALQAGIKALGLNGIIGPTEMSQGKGGK